MVCRRCLLGTWVDTAGNLIHVLQIKIEPSWHLDKEEEQMARGRLSWSCCNFWCPPRVTWRDCFDRIPLPPHLYFFSSRTISESVVQTRWMPTRLFLYLVAPARQTNLSRPLPQMRVMGALPNGELSVQLYRVIASSLFPQTREWAHDPNGVYHPARVCKLCSSLI
jgi:hypothetical protein